MHDSFIWWLDALGAISVLVVGVIIWLYHWPGRDDEKRMWKCVRYQGGGALMSPRRMTVEEVTRWLARDCNAEVAHIDHNHGFIFYRPIGGR